MNNPFSKPVIYIIENLSHYCPICLKKMDYVADIQLTRYIIELRCKKRRWNFTKKISIYKCNWCKTNYLPQIAYDDLKIESASCINYNFIKFNSVSSKINARKDKIAPEHNFQKIIKGIRVFHKKYGSGRVISIKSNMVLISFQGVSKIFKFPSAFTDGFLTLLDKNNKELNRILNEDKKIKNITNKEKFEGYQQNFSKEKISSKKTSNYDEYDFRFIKETKPKPNRYDKLSERFGTPMHIGFLKMNEHDERRHKSRCKYYLKDEKCCDFYGEKCRGSSHCDKYLEK